MDKINLDLLDRKILYQLDLNARQSNAQIARKVKTSKEVVNYRLKRLEKENYILGYHTRINFWKLADNGCNYALYAFHFRKSLFVQSSSVLKHHLKARSFNPCW